ncbi:MAG: hypothetical protein ACYTFZ_03945 [Planctomycetota bacterium]|jgi:hypothetical protein
MSENGQDEAVSRLQSLADELERAHAAAGDIVGKKVAAIDEAVRRIGVPSPAYWHRAEWVQHCQESGENPDQTPEGAPMQHPFVFAWDTNSDGSSVEYALCAARGRDRKCGLHVSACTYRTVVDPSAEEGEEAEERTEVEDVTLVKPDELPLPIRARILDVIERFAEDYEAHVRADRKGLLDGSALRPGGPAWEGEPTGPPSGPGRRSSARPASPPFIRHHRLARREERDARREARQQAHEAHRAAREAVREAVRDARDAAREARRETREQLSRIGHEIRESIPNLKELRKQIKKLRRQIEEDLGDPDVLRKQILESMPDPEELKDQILRSLPDFEKIKKQILADLEADHDVETGPEPPETDAEADSEQAE